MASFGGWSKGGGVKPGGFEQITALNTVKTLTPPSGTSIALVQAETQDVRMRADGTDPTAAIGIILPAKGEPLILQGGLGAFKFIEATASAKLNVQYFG